MAIPTLIIPQSMFFTLGRLISALFSTSEIVINIILKNTDFVVGVVDDDVVVVSVVDVAA